ncbi:phosphatase [Rhodococcus phage Grayson]|nr:phosphatase [Rhodococcus phage Grayson]
MLREIQGDVFESGAPVIAHGCNTVGVMGAGIAKEMRNRYPLMHMRYQQMCDDQIFLPGHMYLYTVVGKDLYIANLATQKYPGRNAKLEYIEESMAKLIQYCEKHNISPIAMPRIGAGIGGLDWKDVVVMLGQKFGDSTVDIHCYYL